MPGKSVSSKTMAVFSKPVELYRFLRSLKPGKTIGFVPTMGALHEGHLSLVAASKARCDVTVVSIFVNPAQFGPTEDFDRYPRPLEQDLALLQRAGADVAFTPSSKDMYPIPPKDSTQVTVPVLSDRFCGVTRPGFFYGVTTVVSRLLNIVGPEYAFFGEKDFQQLVIIRRMVTDLFMPVTIVGCPIVREADGLAMSSRNIYLSATERETAPRIYEALNSAAAIFYGGEIQASALIAHVRRILESTPVRIDYVDIVSPDTLEPRHLVQRDDRILFAGYLGRTRLIDNLAF